MKLIPQISLSFNGQCEAAFKAYARCMNGTITYMMTWGESPMKPAWDGWQDKIFHATLKIGDIAIAGGDVLPGRYDAPKGFSIILQMDDVEAADRIFAALSEEGRVDMPLQETFWAGRFGSLVDRFGVSWTINCERPVVAAT